MPRPAAYFDLLALASSLDTRTPPQPMSIFDCCGVGLIFEPHEGSGGYTGSPINADRFACTGGDGVHFSLLAVAGRSIEESPIVMTVPCSGCWNHIVGENLLDFLALGCRYGYFQLEQLAYDRDDTISAIQSGNPACPCDEETGPQRLEAIRTRFGLKPWPDVRGRLDDLQRRFQPHIQLSAEGLQFATEWDRIG